jgi:hypothetical protein
MVKITETEPESFAFTLANWAMTRRAASTTRKKKLKMAMAVTLTITLTGKTTSHKM